MPSLKTNGTGQRVLGGHPQRLPYQIQIIRKVAPDGVGWVMHECGAVLVSPKFVLTAKHCIYDGDSIIDQNELELLAGGFISIDNKAQNRRIARYITISSEWPIQPDIAMIEVDTPFDINKDVIPACLPNRPAPIGSKCVGKV